jgi:hypothetical protein
MKDDRVYLLHIRDAIEMSAFALRRGLQDQLAAVGALPGALPRRAFSGEL